MGASVRPSLQDVVESVDGKPSLADIVASVDGSGSGGAPAFHKEFKEGRLQKRMASENAVDQASTGHPLLETLEATVGRLPLVGNAIATGRADLDKPFPSLTKAGLADRDQRIATQRKNLEQSIGASEEASPRLFGKDVGVDLPLVGNPINPKLTTLAQMAAGAPLMARLPGSPAVQAGTYGFAHGAGDDPNASLGERLKQGGFEGLLDALIGKGADLATTGVRAVMGKDAYPAKRAMEKARSNISDPNYAQVKTEAATASPLVRPSEIDAPDIKPYLDEVRASRTMGNKPEGEQIAEAYRLMSERQRMLKGRMGNSESFKAGTSLENKDIGAGKAALLTDADKITPSLRTAVTEHAEASQPISAFDKGFNALSQSLKSPKTAKNVTVETKNPDAFVGDAVPKMNPTEANAAGQGILSGIRANAGPLHPLNSIPALTHGSNLLRATDAQSGLLNAPRDLMRSAAAVGGSNTIQDTQAALRELLDHLLGTATP